MTVVEHLADQFRSVGRLQWVTSKEALGLASSTKRPTSCVMIAKVGLKRKLKDGEKEKEGAKETEEEFQSSYKDVEAEVNALVSVNIEREVVTARVES